MTKCEKDKINLMREQGKSYQYIADTFGVSRQRIHQILNYPYNRKNKTATLCIYKGLSEVIYDRKISVSKLCEATGINTDRVTLGHKLKGESDFKISEIKKILKFTGMTFEECFAEKETPAAGTARESR